MKESYECEIATHIGPESCGAAREGGVEALTRERAGRVFTRHSQADADQFRVELTERMRKFHLELHPEKTRLLEFGPHAIDQRQWRGEGKPETFNFLGFTHICVKKRSNGRFTVLRQTIRKRLQTKLNEVKAELRRRMHEPIPQQGKWLRAVVGGHFRYYGVPMNQPALAVFRVVSRLLCKRPSFVFGDGVPGKGAVPLPRPISVEVGCAFIAEFSPGPASVPAKES